MGIRDWGLGRLSSDSHWPLPLATAHSAPTMTVTRQSQRPNDPQRSPSEIFQPHQARQQVQRRGQPTARGKIVPRAVGPDEVQRRRALRSNRRCPCGGRSRETACSSPGRRAGSSRSDRRSPNRQTSRPGRRGSLACSNSSTRKPRSTAADRGGQPRQPAADDRQRRGKGEAGTASAASPLLVSLMQVRPLSRRQAATSGRAAGAFGRPKPDAPAEDTSAGRLGNLPQAARDTWPSSGRRFAGPSGSSQSSSSAPPRRTARPGRLPWPSAGGTARRPRRPAGRRPSSRTPQVGQRQIDATGRGVFLQVAEDVGQLQGDAGLPGRLEGLRPAKSPDVDARQPHGRRHALAVQPQLVERFVARPVQVHFHAVDHGVEVFVGNVESPDGVGQGGERWHRRRD